jgi:translation initiation factor IF-2
MTVSSKVRIYDLAKELKLDTKRLIEEVRREGVDVSVPSNSVSKELAEKIRNKYFPKKETTVKRAVKVVKRAVVPAADAPVVEAAAEPEVHEPEPEAPHAPIACSGQATDAFGEEDGAGSAGRSACAG